MRAVLCLAVGLTVSATVAATAQATIFGATGWGINDDGQLGNGTQFTSTVPTTVSELSEVAGVSAGGHHSLALLANGTVKAWGENEQGQLGNGTTVSSNVPVSVSELHEVVAVAAGTNFSLALLANGKVMAWGGNSSGQLGDGTTTKSTLPVEVSGLSEVTAISAGTGIGSNFALALRHNGTVMAWGANTDGQLGDGTTTSSDVPVEVSELGEATAISAGGSFAVAVLGNGTARAWGSNLQGQLGNGTQTGPVTCSGEVPCWLTPTAVSELTEATAVAAGENFGLALLSSGKVKAWGYNQNGQLGNGTEGSAKDSPVTTSISEVTQIAAGRTHSLALLSSGAVKSWGSDEHGQLGNEHSGFGTSSDTPVAVGELSEVAGVSAGDEFSLAYEPPGPVVTSLSPATGEAKGGTTVEITGEHLAGAKAVKFGLVNATSFTVNSSSSITAVAPAEKPGKVHVKVTTAYGTNSIQGVIYTYTPGGTLEFGRCAKVAKGEGKYKTATCTSLLSGGNFEWQAGVAKAGFTLSGGEATFETAGKLLITCKTETGSGEYVGTKSARNVTIAFKECEQVVLGKCSTSGSSEGELTTGALEGVLGWENQELDNVGWDLVPAEEGAYVLSFSCGGTPFLVRGSVIAPISPVNNMNATFKLKYKQAKGLQKPEHFESEPNDVLEASISGGGFEQIGMAATLTQTNEEEIEINTFV
jgi:alpha-tubulin suppressor-like RCC1 family protein